jgi:hypothetical protein
MIYPVIVDDYSFVTTTRLPFVQERKMKSLKIALVAMSLCAAVAHAQETTAPAADGAAKKAAPPELSRAAGLNARGSAAPADASKEGKCVGPLTFCDIFSGG